MTLSAPARTPVFEHPLDLRHELTARPDRVRFLVIPGRRYFMVDGTDAPGGAAFRDAIAALYPVAYTLHFVLKRRGVTAPVGALEGLFDHGAAGATRTWAWRLLLPVPDEATDAEIQAAIAAAGEKKGVDLVARLRCESWEEGPVAQHMHIGPYDAEEPTISRLHAAIGEAGLTPRGLHHEIYLSDPGRTAPDRLRTLIRQPVEAGAEVGGEA